MGHSLAIEGQRGGGRWAGAPSAEPALEGPAAGYPDPLSNWTLPLLPKDVEQTILFLEPPNALGI